MRAGEHGPDRLYHKFRVFKESTGGLIDQDKEFIFVMRPETYDLATRAALATYADVCEGTYPQLAAEIRAQLDRIEAECSEGSPVARANGMHPSLLQRAWWALRPR